MTVLPELGRQCQAQLRDSLHLEQPSCPSPHQGRGQVGLSAKQHWPCVNYLFPEEGLCPALAVGLDAANVVGRRALQDLQKLLQGGLQG